MASFFVGVVWSGPEGKSTCINHHQSIDHTLSSVTSKKFIKEDLDHTTGPHPTAPLASPHDKQRVVLARHLAPFAFRHSLAACSQVTQGSEDSLKRIGIWRSANPKCSFYPNVYVQSDQTSKGLILSFGFAFRGPTKTTTYNIS